MGRTFAMAVGGFVGAVLALEFNSNFFTVFLSLLAGGVTAWVGYDVPGFAMGTSRACREVRDELRESFAKLQSLNFRRLGWSFLYGSSVFARSFAGLASILVPMAALSPDDRHTEISANLDLIFSGVAAALFGLAVALLCGSEAYNSGVSAEDKQPLPYASRRGWAHFIKYWNPIAWSLWLTYGLLLLVWKLISNVPTAIVWVARMTWRLCQLAFAYTHSEDRRVCFLGAFFVGALGYFYQNPLLGALAGGVLGKLYAPYTRGAALRLKKRLEVKRV